jgi:hypothetical protein
MKHQGGDFSLVCCQNVLQGVQGLHTMITKIYRNTNANTIHHFLCMALCHTDLFYSCSIGLDTEKLVSVIDPQLETYYFSWSY